MNDKDVDIYEILTRFGGIAISVLLWIVSMRFSVDGFKIASSEDAWVGYILGATVTYLQIVFNRGAPNKTLYLAGVFAYIYGISTNLIGIMAIRENAFTFSLFSENPLSVLLQLVVVITIAAAVEVIPEHLALYSFRPEGNDGDFIDSLFKGMPKRNGGQNRGNRKPPSNKQPSRKSGNSRRGNQGQQNRRPQSKPLLDRIRGNDRQIPRNRGDRRDNVRIFDGEQQPDDRYPRGRRER